jgi:uncharacterized protein
MLWLRRIALLLVGLATTAYAGVCGYMYSQQRSLLFRPDPSDVTAMVAALPGARAVTIMTQDGERIHLWWKPPARADQPVFFYLHGNAANLSRRASRFAELPLTTSGLLAVSWRGYGGSSGMPSHEGFKRDAMAAYRWLRSEAGVAPSRIVAFGESLGTAVAIHLAATQPVAGLILDAPYDSIAAIGQQRYPWLPVRLLIRDPFDAISDAPKVTVPVLARLCRTDWATPIEHGQRLLAALPKPAEIAIIERRCHVPPLREGILPALPGFLRRAGFG